MRRIKSLSFSIRSPASLRHLSVDLVSLRANEEAFVTQLVEILQPPESDWNSDQLRSLISSGSGETPSSPSLLLGAARQLGSSRKALKLFDHLEASSESHLPKRSESLSATFQGVLELASREPDFVKRLSELYAVSRERNVSLTINSVTLLLGSFRRAGMRDEMVSVFEGVDGSSKTTHVCNMMLDSLVRLGCHEEALKVFDEMPEPNNLTARIVFPWLEDSVAVGKRLGDEVVIRVVSRLGARGVFPENVEFTRLINGLCLAKKVNLAWEIWNSVVDSGRTVSAPPCNALLTGLSKMNDSKRMNQVMVKMQERDIKPTAVTFGILINCFCKSRRIDEALEMFEKMRGEQDLVTPDVITYNTLINGLCKVGRQEKALSLMEEMRSENRCRPDRVTYNCLIDGFNKVGNAETAMKLFEQMKSDQVEMDVVTLNTLIDGMCRNGKVNSAVRLFEEIEKGGEIKGNAFTYSILISTFCSINNVKKAKDLFDRLCGTGGRADAVVYYNLITGLCLAGKMNDAGAVVAKLKQAGLKLDVITYNVLVNGFCRTGNIDRAYLTIKEMEDNGIDPNAVTYNMLIAYMSKNGDMETAREMLKTMFENGHRATVHTYGALIHGHCLDHDFDEAVKIFRSMGSDSKLVPNTVIYNTLISYLCKRGRLQGAFSFVDEMRAKGVKLNTTTYNALFQGLRDDNSSDKALKVMDQMVKDGCSPDFRTVEILTEWLPGVGEVDKLKEFITEGTKVSKYSS